MKKIAGLLLAVLLLTLCCVCVFTSCSNKIDITFVQSGQEDVVVTIKKGESLEDIPNPAQKTGYTVVWDVTDFSNIDEDLTVNAVETPNEYTIYYKVAELINISAKSQKVTFGDNVVLLKPSNTPPSHKFGGWKIEGTDTVLADGVYDVASDVTLVPEWVPDEWSENE